MEQWLHTQQTQAGFSDKVDEICTLYRDSSQLRANDIHVISVDEKTGIQALEYRAVTPLKPTQIQRQDSEYTRHGTQCLIANIEVATGKVIYPTVGDTSDLGCKGKAGILKNMDSRMAFLASKTHRIRFVYTPKHASWLNQIECWFSIISRQLLKRLSVASKDALNNLIHSYIDYYNQTTANPFKWMYTRKTSCAV
ncbi:transposase [uncultured Shewanella sp.]|uniref:transposase n=1 Tax=uncultured Shewanella sp. TaxID=173975 RepID=UPI00260F4801|nr:transposase [uncultured Shewanella sp.]